MNQQSIVDRPDREDRAARARIDAAAKLLRGGKSDVADDFVALLFGRAAPEDLVGYDAAELRCSPQRAFSQTASRASKIRFESPDAPDGEQVKSISVIEIVNDDMPFLVDSVMAELTERGLVTRLVAHPILAVARRKTGKLTAPPGEAGKNKDETRESVIHIHVARVENAGRRAEVVRGLEQVLAEVRRCVKDWRPMVRRVNDVIEDIKAIRRRCRWTTSRKRSSSSNGWRPTTSPCSACATTRLPARSAISSRCWKPGSACCAVAMCRCSRVAARWFRSRRNCAPSSMSRRR